MRTSRLSHKNTGFLLRIFIGCYLLFIGISHFNTTAEKYEAGQPFQNGVLTFAKIVSIPHSVKGSAPVSVRFTDDLGEVRDARVWMEDARHLRIDQAIEISYEREDPGLIRVPSQGMSKSMYTGGRAFYIAWILGALCVFPWALWTRFREPAEKPALNTNELAAEYRVKHNYFRLFVSYFTGAIVLFMVWAIVVLTITEILALPVWLERGLLLAWHAVLLWKIPLPALRVLFNDPLTISHSGVSIYGRRPVPWKDMSQIKFISHSHYKRQRGLVIALNDSSTIKGHLSWRKSLRNMGPVVHLSLFDTRYDVDDIVTAINHFGLEARDPVAAKRFRESSIETGIIETRPGMQATLSDAGNDPVFDVSDQDDHYMSGGFHTGHRK